MYCKNCGVELQENAAVCLNCGVQYGVGNKYCRHCGAQPDPLAAVCVKCGHSLKAGKLQKSQNGDVKDLSDAIKICWKKYADFRGRAGRAEYWYWVLFCLILSFIPLVNIIATLALCVPSIAVGVRRLHDIGKSGWYYLLCLIPLIGSVLLIVWFCQEGQVEENEYGTNPNL